MKRKSIVPLLAIAFIVAVISTGIFYGLFVGTLKSAPTAAIPTQQVVMTGRALPAGAVIKAEDLKLTPWAGTKAPAGAFQKIDDAVGKSVITSVADNELLTASLVGSKSGLTTDSGSLGIPDGMRAVSLQVQDSSGVVALLKPGHRVDVQVVSNLSSPQGTEPYLRTVLENMTVLTVPKDPQSSRGPHVVTVLATPKEAAALGLADSSAKVRFALRNPLDPKKDHLNAIALSSLFRLSSPLPTENTRAIAGATPAPAQKPVQLTVRVIGVQAGVWQQFAPHLLGFANNSAVPQVSALRLGPAFEETVSRLAGTHDLEVGTTSKLVAYGRRELSLRTGADGSHLRVQFQPFVLGDNSLRLRLNPELTSGATTRRVDTEIELVNGQSFLVRGLTGPDDASSVWNSLFPNRKATPPWKDLILLVEARLI